MSAALTSFLLNVLIWAVIICCYGVITAVDATRRIIPDEALWALAMASAVQALACEHGLTVMPYLPGVTERIVWALAVVAFVTLMESVWRRTHDGESGMGYGDVKLIGVLLFWCGPAGLVAMSGACLSALVESRVRRERTFAFGPHLCGWLVLTLIVMSSGAF